MSAKQTAAIVKQFYSEIWNKRNKSFIPKLLCKEFAFRASLGVERRGYGGFASYVDFIHEALKGYRCEILDMVFDGNKVFAKMLFSGIHQNNFMGYKPSFKRIEWHGAALFTFDHDKIIDLWVLGDIQSLIKQLEDNKKAAR